MPPHYTPFTIYGRTDPYCTYCEQAKQLLARRSMPFTFVDVGKDITIEQLKEIVPGAQSVPQIFEGQLYVGGFKELKQYLEFS